MNNTRPKPDNFDHVQVHTTPYGTQSVDPVEVIHSEQGWKEISQIIEAYESGELEKIQHLIP